MEMLLMPNYAMTAKTQVDWNGDILTRKKTYRKRWMECFNWEKKKKRELACIKITWFALQNIKNIRDSPSQQS